MCLPYNDDLLNMLNRDQRTTFTIDSPKIIYNSLESNCINNRKQWCYCKKNSFNCNAKKNYNNCDRYASIKKGLSEPKIMNRLNLRYLKSIFLCCCILILVSQTSARPTYNSNSRFPRHTRSSALSLRMASGTSFDQTDYIRILEDCSNGTNMQREIDLARIKKMLESTINTSLIALQESAELGNAFVKVYDPDISNLTEYHNRWKNKKPEDYNLTWLFPNNKRLPKDYKEGLSNDYRNQLKSGDLHSNATKLLLESYVRLQHLAHGLNHVLNVINRDGRSHHSQEIVLRELTHIFNDAIDQNKRVLNEIGDLLKEILLCDTILEQLTVPETIVKDLEYQETRNWIIFREYANQLEFNIQAFQILVDRIEEAKIDV